MVAVLQLLLILLLLMLLLLLMVMMLQSVVVVGTRVERVLIDVVGILLPGGEAGASPRSSAAEAPLRGW